MPTFLDLFLSDFEVLTAGWVAGACWAGVWALTAVLLRPGLAGMGSAAGDVGWEGVGLSFATPPGDTTTGATTTPS